MTPIEIDMRPCWSTHNRRRVSIRRHLPCTDDLWKGKKVCGEKKEVVDQKKSRRLLQSIQCFMKYCPLGRGSTNGTPSGIPIVVQYHNLTNPNFPPSQGCYHQNFEFDLQIFEI